jgi:colanic acid biosynthesis protein WcaH
MRKFRPVMTAMFPRHATGRMRPDREQASIGAQHREGFSLMAKSHAPGLDAESYARVVRDTPLVSIDLILHDPDGHVLLGLRNNEPAKGSYFVPGGVIRKNEKLADAFDRILETETGLRLPISEARLMGVYEHHYPTNRFNDPAYGTHYVVLTHALKLAARPDVRRDDQHSVFAWMTPAEIVQSPVVHENTKAYFRK